ncbi:MFS transporter [Stieleria sp. JC731]|uniref:NTP/NDP exchange transporter n=1 Tax=Pirellulaceae TaxID=2691357 RepID=UPI001E49E6EE|nr:MFS transporter [Stieleria sp. JC731]MCC9602983.1 MFS transporter [Stieleria sp. JC731]
MTQSNPYRAPNDSAEATGSDTVQDGRQRSVSTQAFNEQGVVWWATCWFFFTLLSYSIVRPVRETMGAIGGTKQLQGLMLVTFAVMLVAVPAYSALVNRLSRRWLVRIVVHFFTVSLIGFSFAQRSGFEPLQVWSARAFFVWVNVFALVGTSMFWSVLADLFSSDQAKRLFGRIAAGGTVGAIAGSFLTSQIATKLSTPNLLLIPAVTLQCGLWFAWRLERAVRKSQQLIATDSEDPAHVARTAKNVDEESAEDNLPVGGLWQGITQVFSSVYLLSICLFLFFGQAAGTQLYFQQADIVAKSVVDDQEKIQIFAYIDFSTQLLTLFAQVILSGFVLKRFGVSIALMVLPAIYMISFTALSWNASLAVVATAMVISRATAYGITVPSREVLFTVVSREQKYKSKNFIDTVVLRGGDATAGQILGSLKNFAGMTFATVNLYSLPILGVWLFAAYRLGQRQQKRAAESDSASSNLAGSGSDRRDLSDRNQ